ncbi:MAG: site-specific integrase [Rhizobiales bacterium]|nr:site-specific integrase [Hyphomicrobiales bacterium]
MGGRIRGRPKGTTGQAALLGPDEIKALLRSARQCGRFVDRAELVIALSIELGLRASELAELRWANVYHPDGIVRDCLEVRRAYTKTRTVSSIAVTVHSSKLRILLADYREKLDPHVSRFDQAPLFESQRGGHMTAASMTRFIAGIYQRAGIVGGSSRSGRRTLIARLDWQAGRKKYLNNT